MSNSDTGKDAETRGDLITRAARVNQVIKVDNIWTQGTIKWCTDFFERTGIARTRIYWSDATHASDHHGGWALLAFRTRAEAEEAAALLNNTPLMGTRLQANMYSLPPVENLLSEEYNGNGISALEIIQTIVDTTKTVHPNPNSKHDPLLLDQGKAQESQSHPSHHPAETARNPFPDPRPQKSRNKEVKTAKQKIGHDDITTANDAEDKLKCNHCPQRFTQSSSRWRHERTKHGVEHDRPSDQGEKAPQESQDQQQSRNKEVETAEQNSVSHDISRTTDAPAVKLTCSRCTQAYTRLGNLKKHEKNKHGIE